MSKTTPTPKEFQIAGTEDLGCEIFMTRNVPATLSHVEHTVCALSGRDEMALKQMGYQFHHSFGIASKIFRATSPLALALLAPSIADLAAAEQMSFPRADFQMLLRCDDFYNPPVFAMPGDAYSEVR
jgi:hypothetical protein